MNSKKAKKLRKELKYNLKEERKQGKTYSILTHKTEKDKDGNNLSCGIVSDQLRRMYQLAKKYF